MAINTSSLRSPIAFILLFSVFGCSHAFEAEFESLGLVVHSEEFKGATDYNIFGDDFGYPIFKIDFNSDEDLAGAASRYEIGFYYGLFTDCSSTQFDQNLQFPSAGIVGRYNDAPAWSLALKKWELSEVWAKTESYNSLCLQIAGGAMWGLADSSSNLIPIDMETRAAMANFINHPDSLEIN